MGVFSLPFCDWWLLLRVFSLPLCDWCPLPTRSQGGKKRGSLCGESNGNNNGGNNNGPTLKRNPEEMRLRRGKSFASLAAAWRDRPCKHILGVCPNDSPD
eukprot:1183883-Prorocentrum_minimum.AAC.1